VPPSPYSVTLSASAITPHYGYVCPPGYGSVYTAFGVLCYNGSTWIERTWGVVSQTATLTATANTDVGPTPYHIDIWDQTTGTMVSTVSSGTTDTSSVSGSSGSQTYVAYITSDTTAPGSPVATSSPVTVTW
jgi:hypothetical protein